MKSFKMKLAHLFFGIALPVICLTSCGTTGEVVEQQDEVLESTTYHSIAKGVLHGAGEEGISKSVSMIKSEDAWNEFKAKMDKSHSVTSTITYEVNFEEEMLLACFDEVRPNGSYSMEIVDVLESSKILVVKIKLHHSDMPSTSIMVQPYEILVLPKSDKGFGVQYVE